jgi:dihydroflavonol-4-reductase
MRVFLTGAAGPLGRAITEELRQHGNVVVGQIRRRSGVSTLKRLGAEPVMNDLTRARHLADAMSGCDLVIHVAQFFDFWAPEPSQFHAVNVYGSENTMAAAVEARVPRAVFVSTSLTIGEMPGFCGTERTVHRGYTLTAYERSKLAAEANVLRYRSKAMDVVVVNPGLVVSAGDPGWVGRLIADYVSGRRRLAAETPMGWIWAHDAAAGVVAAAQSGQSGARYILNGDTMSVRGFMSRVTKLSGRSAPMPRPRTLTLGVAALSTAVARVSGSRPAISMDEARFSGTGFHVDGTHACETLGVRYTPIGRYLPPIVASYRSALKQFDA